MMGSPTFTGCRCAGLHGASPKGFRGGPFVFSASWKTSTTCLVHI